MSDDETCTDCHGTGYNSVSERRCDCQPPMTQPDKLVVTQEAEACVSEMLADGQFWPGHDSVIRMRELVTKYMNQAADERQEMCAKVAEEFAKPNGWSDFSDGQGCASEAIAEAIRSIGRGGM